MPYGNIVSGIILKYHRNLECIYIRWLIGEIYSRYRLTLVMDLKKIQSASAPLKVLTCSDTLMMIWEMCKVQLMRFWVFKCFREVLDLKIVRYSLRTSRYSANPPPESPNI